MFKNILPKYGLDGNKDVVFTDPGVGNQAVALMSGAVDAAIVSVEQRYAGIDNGMKELMYLGNEVKNSWGTTAASDKFMKEQPKLMAGFTRATLKALRLIRNGSRRNDRRVRQVFRFACGDRDPFVRRLDRHFHRQRRSRRRHAEK